MGQPIQEQRLSLFFMTIACCMLEFLMLGSAHRDLVPWTRIAYIVALVLHAPCAVAALAATMASMLGNLLHGQVIYECALTILIAVLASFMLQRVIARFFAKSVAATFLMTLYLMGAWAIQVMGQPQIPLDQWTILRLFVTLGITNVLLKYMS